mmetsp:Transcript_70389/g.132847  ORF Transcript_70389/g.132847 Transcript_70389/m.132847 type:complete len:336 (+) Transcript_70389:131-1138(+)
MGQAFGRVFNVSEYVFPVLPATYDASHEMLVFFPTEADIDAPAMMLAPRVENRRHLGLQVALCVIYFHPNAADIGDCLHEMETIRDGAFGGDAIVVAPEYPGYGLLMEYTPSVEGIDRVAAASWRFCTEELGFSPEQIILWGRSIGTGPATALAWNRARNHGGMGTQRLGPSKGLEDTRPLGALVLLAPFISISAVVLAHVSPLLSTFVSPMWQVQEMVGDITLQGVPLCVLHPAEDDIVPPSHGKAVLDAAAARRKLGIWLVGANHNFVLHEEHLEKVHDFITHNQLPGNFYSGKSPRDLTARDVDESDCQELVNRLVAWGNSSETWKTSEQTI